jgi:hypothetical protein
MGHQLYKVRRGRNRRVKKGKKVDTPTFINSYNSYTYKNDLIAIVYNLL